LVALQRFAQNRVCPRLQRLGNADVITHNGQRERPFGRLAFARLGQQLPCIGLHVPIDNDDLKTLLGNFLDGGGNFAVYQPGQKMIDPGVPQHLFNILVNYKHPSGFGAQTNIQVTGPIDTTQSGYLNLAATNAAAAADGVGTLVGPGGTVPLSVVGANGYYTSPRIPWQYTVNGAVFYNFQNYLIKFSIYNLTNERNLQNDIPYYGNDFLTRVPPRSFDLSFSGKF